jgi:hypothetical protein
MVSPSRQASEWFWRGAFFGVWRLDAAFGFDGEKPSKAVSIQAKGFGPGVFLSAAASHRFGFRGRQTIQSAVHPGERFWPGRFLECGG